MLPSFARCAESSAASAHSWPISTRDVAPTVIDLQGCEHADGFGHLDKLTLEQEWQLIEAALTAESDDAG